MILGKNWELSGCLRRRRLAFPTGKVARPLAVTDESQNAAYFLQPNWNGSIVHPPAHKQSRFQLTRLAARATLPAREGKCALRAQDAHLYKSQFAKASLVEGPRGCYGRNQVRNALSGGTAAQIPICRGNPLYTSKKLLMVDITLSSTFASIRNSPFSP